MCSTTAGSRRRSLQWGLMADGTVQAGHGDPDPTAIHARVRAIPDGHRFVITLPAGSERLTVVFSDSDDGASQERLIATSTLQPGNAHTLSHVQGFDAACTPAGQVKASWDPRFADAGEASAPLLASRLAFDAIEDTPTFVRAFTEALAAKASADKAFGELFLHGESIPDLAWAEAQLPGWRLVLYAEAPK